MVKHSPACAAASVLGRNIDHIHVGDFAPEPTVPKEADRLACIQGNNVLFVKNAAFDPGRVYVRIMLDKPHFVRAIGRRYILIGHAALILIGSLFGNAVAGLRNGARARCGAGRSPNGLC